MNTHESAVIDAGASIGKGTRIWHFSHVCSGAKIGRNCNFGQNCYVASGVEVGNNVKVQNGVSLYTGLHIEDFVFIGPHAVFTNDLHPRSIGPWDLKHTHLRYGCSIGANSTILCGIEIGEFAMIGCGSVVIRSVPPRSLFVGNPARFVRSFDESEIEMLRSEIGKVQL